MSIVGGLDVHRRQITFDYVDTVTGRVSTGRIAPADRPHLRAWLARRFADVAEAHFAFEAGTGWRYVAEEIIAAALTAHLAETAQTAQRRGRKSKAKTDRADARLQRELLVKGDLPECWIPPAVVLDCRAILQTYRDLREQHEGWVQRIAAVLFHHGAPQIASLQLGRPAERDRLAAVAAAHLPRTACWQVEVAMRQLQRLQAELVPLERQIGQISRRMRGPRLLRQQLYGVGPITALALTCWLGGAGRGFSSRGAVRFTGLDVTVKSSDGRRLDRGGQLSRQGPPVLRWLLYEAGKNSARPTAPDHAYYASVQDNNDGKRAALSEGRKITRKAIHLLAPLGDDAFILDAPTAASKPIPALTGS